MRAGGIIHRAIAETPITVVDTETTGLYPCGDRVIEIALVRADPGNEPSLVLETLVNPRRPVAATEIHGITDADVADAPTFEEIAGHVVEALRGSVFASYNVYFDAKFVREEFRRSGVKAFPPHLCLMYMRPVLGLGAKCSLGDACRESGVRHVKGHYAGADALAAAALWKQYLDVCGRNGVRTFGDLARLKTYRFTSSFDDPLLGDLTASAPLRPVRFKPRVATARSPVRVPAVVSDRHTILGEYWDALMAAMSDLDVTPHEVFYLRAKQSALALKSDELRWLHARAFSGVLADMCQDKAITASEAQALSRVALALRELGWAPGDEPAELAVV